MVRFKVRLNFLSWPSRRGVLFNTRNVVASGMRLIVSVSDADVPKNVPKHKIPTSGGVCKSLIYKAEGRGFDAELSELAEQATRSERTAWRVSAKSVNPEALEHGGPGIRTPKRSRAAVFKTAALPVRSSPPDPVN